MHFWRILFNSYVRQVASLASPALFADHRNGFAPIERNKLPNALAKKRRWIDSAPIKNVSAPALLRSTIRIKVQACESIIDFRFRCKWLTRRRQWKWNSFSRRIWLNFRNSFGELNSISLCFASFSYVIDDDREVSARIIIIMRVRHLFYCLSCDAAVHKTTFPFGFEWLLWRHNYSAILSPTLNLSALSAKHRTHTDRSFQASDIDFALTAWKAYVCSVHKAHQRLQTFRFA